VRGEAHPAELTQSAAVKQLAPEATAASARPARLLGSGRANLRRRVLGASLQGNTRNLIDFEKICPFGGYVTKFVT